MFTKEAMTLHKCTESANLRNSIASYVHRNCKMGYFLATGIFTDTFSSLHIGQSTFHKKRLSIVSYYVLNFPNLHGTTASTKKTSFNPWNGSAILRYKKTDQHENYFHLVNPSTPMHIQSYYAMYILIIYSQQ